MNRIQKMYPLLSSELKVGLISLNILRHHALYNFSSCGICGRIGINRVCNRWNPSNLSLQHAIELPQHDSSQGPVLLQLSRRAGLASAVLGYQSCDRSRQSLDHSWSMVSPLSGHLPKPLLTSELSRPDHRDGTYDQYCDESRQYTNITQILRAAGRYDVLNYMNTYWKN